jgi:ketosteroid isomerase-like protein
MYKCILAFACALLIVQPAGAADATDVMSVVHRWVDGFNAADAHSAIATCADQAAIIDDFPPHEWHGSGACARWFGDFASMSKAEGITNPHIMIEAASHTEMTKEFAYVIVPARLSFDRKGTRILDQGILTVTLHNGISGWRITGWVWSDQ